MFTSYASEGTEVINNRKFIEEEDVASEDRLRELEEKYEDYKVYDNQGEKIGKVDDLFVDETDREEYIGVKMGFLGMKSTLIPMDIVRVNEGERSIEVSESKDHVKSAPSFDDDEDITPDFEDRIRSYFGLESMGTSGAGYGGHSGTAEEPTDRGSQGYETDDDTKEYEDTGEHEGATPDDSRDAPEYRDDERSTSRDERGDSEGPSEGLFSTGDSGSSAGETTGGTPTTRETEETETFKEGGRTKIRRRVIREEIIEEDDQDPRGL
jgi:hypothetical protein